MTLDDRTAQPLDTGSPSLDEFGPSTGNGHDEAAVIALEPSEPSHGACGRLRLAVAARSAIGHPNLVSARLISEEDGRFLVALELCPHPSLTELLAEAPLQPTECARVLDGAAAGADTLSQRGLVAWDLTPDGVLVHPDHGGVLMDLGIPPELLSRVPVEDDPGVAFRSPEELRRQPVDVLSSVYSLGVILFTALTGDPPYGGTPVEIYSSHLKGVPPRPSERRPALPSEFDAVVARAMAVDPAQRYPDARTLSRAVKATADLAPVLPDLKPPKRRPRPARKAAPGTSKAPERPTETEPRGEEPPTPAAQERSQPRPADAVQTERPPTKSRRQSRPTPKREIPTQRPTDARPMHGTRASENPSQPDTPRQAPERPTPRSRGAPSKRQPAEASPTQAAEDQPQRPADKRARPRPPEAPQAPRVEDRRLTSKASPAQPAAQERSMSRPADTPPKSETVDVHQVPQSARVPPTPQLPERRPKSGPAHGFAALVRGSLALIATALVVAGAAGRRGQAVLRRLAVSATSGARHAAAAFRRGAHALYGLVLRACRLVLRAATRAAEGVKRFMGSASGAARRGGASRHRFASAIGRVARGGAQAAGRGAIAVWALCLRAVRLVVAATPRVAGFARGIVLFGAGAARRGGAGFRRYTAAVGSGAASSRFGATLPHAKLVLAAVAAIVVCGVSGIALGRVIEPEEGASSITRSGLTVTLPPGWEPAEINPGRPSLSSPIAAVPSGETNAGFVVGTLSSQAGATRMFEGVQQAGEGRTQVRLGGLLGWRYAGLQPGRGLVGTGFLVPTTSGAVVMLCHASRYEGARLDECARAATTIVVGGEPPRQLPMVDRSREQLSGVIATLRSSRSKDRERLAAADLAPGQIRAAISLKVSHQRAARSLERISPLQNGQSLKDMATALRAVGAAYGRLAVAAATGSRSAYREARRAVAREEGAFRRELARVSAP
jgi:serine/threonine protein kinase